MLLLGLGAGTAFPALMNLAMSGATPQDAGLASGLVNTTAQVGGALGLAVLATLSTSRSNALHASGHLDRVGADHRLPPPAPWGPTQATARSSVMPGGDLADLIEGDRIERRDRGVGVDLLAEDDRLPRGVARDGVGVVERQHHSPPRRRRARGRPHPRWGPDRATPPRSRASGCTPRRTWSSRGPSRAAGWGRPRRSGRSRTPSSRGPVSRGTRRTAASPSSPPAAWSRSSSARADGARSPSPRGGRSW